MIFFTFTMGKTKKKPTVGASSKKEPKKLNPFEVHINRQKFEVLGRKLKSDRGLPGISRSKAIKKVSQTKSCHLSEFLSDFL